MSQAEASAALEDRGKMDLSGMADMGRQLSGHIRPRLYTVTDRMRTAMKIDDLEANATNAFLKGDDEGMRKYRGEADEMRKSNPWLKFNDRNPTAKMELSLEQANKALAEINQAVQYVMTAR